MLLSAKQYDWRADFDKTETYLLQCDYKNALKKSKLFMEYLNRNKTANELYLTAGYFQEARIFNGYGDFNSYKKSCNAALKGIESYKNDNPNDYTLAILEGVQAFMEYGNYRQAEKLIGNVHALTEQSKVSNADLANEVKYKLAQIYYHQGYLLRSQALLAGIKQFKKSRIVERDAVTDTKTGSAVFTKLSGKEVAARKRNYAEVLNFQIKLYIANGAYAEADSAQEATYDWIRKQLGKKDFAMIENSFLEGVLLETRNDRKGAYKAYTEALDLSVSSKGLRYSSYGKEAARLYQKAILIETLVKKRKEASKDENAYNSKVKRFYGKKNFYYTQLQLLEAQIDIVNNDDDDGAEELTALLAEKELIPATHLERARAYEAFYILHSRNDDFENAEKDLQEIIRIKKELMGENAPAYHKALLELANFEVTNFNKFKEAEAIYKTSLEGVLSIEIDHRSRNYINYMYNQARLYELTDRFATARNILDKAFDEIKTKYGTSHVNYAIGLEKLASLDMDLGHYADAEKRLNTSLDIYKFQGATSYNYSGDYARSYETLARLQMIQAKYEEAEKSLKKSSKLIRDSEGDLDLKEAGTAEEFAALYIYTGKYQEIESLLKQDIDVKLKRFGETNPGLIHPYNQLGSLYLITGDYTEAEKSVRKAAAISISVFGDSSIKYTQSLRLLGNIYTEIGDYEKAEEAVKRVVEIQNAKYGKNHILLANSLNDLALVKFLNKGSKTEVEALFLEGLKIIKSNLGDKNPEYAEVLKNLALFYLETSRIKEAETNLQKANAFWTEKFGASNIHSAEIMIMQGNIDMINREYTDARDKYTIAKEIYLRIFDSNHPSYVKVLSRIGQVNYILGEYKLAIRNFDETTTNYLTFIKKYFPSLSEREKNKFWNLIKNDFEFYNSMAIKLHEANPELIGNAYNFALNTKALLLSSSIKVRQRIVNSKDEALIKKYEDWVAKKEFLVTAISMSNDQRKANLIDIKILEKDIEALEKDLSSSSELFVADSERETVYNWMQVKQNLKEHEVAIEMIRFRKFTNTFTDTICYAALIVTPHTKGHPELVLLENGKELETKFIKYYRNSIKLKSEDMFSYNNYWKPFTKYIDDNTVVYFSPEGVYSQINLETLKSPEGSYVIDKNEVILISNTKELIARPRPSKSKKQMVAPATDVSLFGNPSYYKQGTLESMIKVSQLPGAEKEVKTLFTLLQSSHWKPRLYLEKEAEEDSVKNLKSPRVFHIATHGFFLEDVKEDNSSVGGLNESRSYRNPLLRSGLLLRNGGTQMQSDNVYDYNSEDGVLTAYEAMNLNLDKTDLVVLSACETGLGEVQLGEGVYGLQRAFLVAGAQSIIMSLFKVSDEVTQELMLNFYKKWITGGDKRKAFVEAKKEIKAKYPEPIFWGSFVMIGMN